MFWKWRWNKKEKRKMDMKKTKKILKKVLTFKFDHSIINIVHTLWTKCWDKNQQQSTLKSKQWIFWETNKIAVGN